MANTETFVQIWDNLSDGLQTIYFEQGSVPRKVDFKRYMQLKTCVYNYCTGQHNEEPQMRRGVQNGQQGGVGNQFVGSALYENLKDFLERHTQRLRSDIEHHNGVAFLKAYNDKWSRFQFSSKVVNDIFSYLNRHWIKRELDEDKENIYEVYNLAIVSWQRQLFTFIADQLTAAILKLIENERNGESITTSLVSGTLGSYLEMGINETEEHRSRIIGGQRKRNRSLAIFKEYFEAKFLEETRIYYKAEAQEFLLNSSVVAYLKKVEDRLTEERLRVERYLDPLTIEPFCESLMKACDDVLIAEHLDRFREEFDNLLKNNQVEDLARMFSLCERVEGALEDLKPIMERHVERKVQAMDKAFTSFINHNSLKEGNKAAHKSPELLVRYFDMLLRKSAKNPSEDEVEEALNQVMIIFSYTLYVEDKDRQLFNFITDQLTAAILKLIENERNGESITTSLVSGTLGSYLEMGIGQRKRNRSLTIFKKYFEARFLDETRIYYKTEAQEFLLNSSVVAYLKKVEDRLKEERLRVERYLDPSTIEPLMKACDDVLISDHLDRFRGEFDNLLENNQVEDLARMFSLCERVEGALDVLKAIMECHIERKGRNAIKLLPDPANDPKVYINVILGLHKQFATLINVTFKNDSGFVQAMDKAFTSFINRNSATEGNKAAHKSPELLARYCDMLLRKSAKNPSEDEVEEALNQVMIIFKYVEDKDVFQKFYSKMLAKRLVYELSASEDAEKSMLEKLKKMCGFEYTNKLTRMYTDTTLSKEVSLKFKKHAQDKNIDLQKIDLSVQVLAQGTWPFPIAETCSVPPILADVLGKFQAYYINQHNGRKLTYLNHMSRGEVICNHIPGKRYTVVASMGQMAVLLLFNDDIKFTFQQLLDSLNFKPDQLIQTLQPLIKLEMLKTNGMKMEKDVPMDTVIELNSKFTSKKIRIDLSKAVTRAEAPKERSDIQHDLEEDRKMVVQAAIVRVMKMRMKYQHQALIAEVIKQLSIRFTPNVKLIKICIDILIEKEYLARVEGERDWYDYLS